MKDEVLRLKYKGWRIKDERMVGWKMKDEGWRMKVEGWKIKDEG